MPLPTKQAVPMKRCSCCGEWFPVTDFGSNRQNPDGRAYYTLAHAALKQKAFRKAKPGSVAASKKKYLDKLRQQNDPTFTAAGEG